MWCVAMQKITGTNVVQIRPHLGELWLKNHSEQPKIALSAPMENGNL